MMPRLVWVLVVGLGLNFGGRHVLNAPVDSTSTKDVTVEVPTGAGAREVGRTLHEAGVLRSPLGFVARVVLARRRGDLRAGTYTFSPRESGGQILSRLVRGDALPPDLAVTFPEGFTLAQVADRLAARGVVEREALVQAAMASRFRGEFRFLESAPANASLEGYLFPDTYRFEPRSSREDVLRRFLRRFDGQWNAVRSAVCTASEAAPCRRSVHEITTMASIIEREVRSAEDRRLVSGILWSRLDAGVGLAADATVRYAINDWENSLTDVQLRIDSPYNTRRYRGLPPGPIGNPGRESLAAALSPTASDYFYYLSARADGRTIFSRTLGEHNEAKRQHLR